MDQRPDLNWLRQPRTVGEIVRWMKRLFEAQEFWAPGQDARALVGHAIGFDFTQLVLRADTIVTDAQRLQIEALVRRRLAFEPVGRILGSRDFRGLELEVSPATLEPREDTEILVERAIRFLQEHRIDQSLIADIGTGTGAILIAILTACPNAVGIAIDVSLPALETAKRNAQRHCVNQRFRAVVASYASGLAPRRFDLIVSNPPYIPTAEIATLEADVRDYDPHLALDGGPDGLVGYRALIPDAFAALRPDGALMVEIGWQQAQAVIDLFAAAGFVNLDVSQDRGARDRVITGQRPI